MPDEQPLIKNLPPARRRERPISTGGRVRIRPPASYRRPTNQYSEFNRRGLGMGDAVPRLVGFQTNINPPIGEVIKGAQETSKEFEQKIFEVAEALRQDLEFKLQAAAEGEYRRESTGRFARGIKLRISKRRDNNNASAYVQVTVPGYRESRFLTNIGQSGYFTFYPVEAYEIHAQEGRKLKIPFQGFETFIPRGRRKEQTFTVEAPGGKAQSYFYPTFVTHPGFRRDVVSEVVETEIPYFQERLARAAAVVWAPGSRNIQVIGTRITSTG